MLRSLSLLLPVPAALLLAGCGAVASLHAGNEETDRIAQVVSDAIAWPRQESATDYARAAVATSAGQDGRLTVIGVSELEADDLSDPFGELTFLVHLEGSTSGLFRTDPVTACYHAKFGFYGVEEPPRRTGCPEDPVAVVLPTMPPEEPEREVAEDADRWLRAQLRRLAPAPSATQLEAELVAGVPVPSDARRPGVDAAVDGEDVGVAISGDDECLLGARTGGTVEVWRPSRVQMQPGELTCHPETALATLGQEPPH
jgi:hypothetical protein